MIDDAVVDTTNEAVAPPVTDWLKLSRDAFTASSTYFDAFVRPAIEEGIRQFNSQHATGSKYLTEQYRLKSKIFRPMTRKAIRKHEASAARALFSTEDVVSVRPVDDNNELHRAAAAVFGFLLQHRLTRSIPWFLTAMGAYQEAMNNGVVASIQEWEYDKTKKVDKPVVRLIPPENIRIDAAADWTDPVNTSPYVIQMIPMYVKDVKARMKRKAWKPLEEATILAARQSVNDSTRIVREGRSDSKDQPQANNDFTIVWVHRNIIEMEGVDYVYYTMGTQELLTDPVPLEQVWFHGKRPIVIGSCIIEAHKVYPSSFNKLVKGMNDEGNDLANLRLDNIKLILNPRHQALRNKNVDIRSITRNVPSSVTMVDSHNDVKTITPTDATGSSFQEQDRLNAEFDDLAGGFSGSSVATNRNLNETVGGMNLLSGNGDLISDYQMRTWIETWVEPVLRQLILLERDYETDETVLQLAGSAAKLEAIPEELLQQEVLLSVNVGIGNTNPQNQVDRFVYGLTALSRLKPEMLKRLKDEEIVKELFGKLGYRDGARFFDFGADTSDPVQQLTMDKLKAEIKQIEDNSALKQVEAMLKRVETLYSSMQAAQTAATVPGVVPIADEIAKSAGFNDLNAPPIYPEPEAPVMDEAQALPAVQENTSPMFPPRLPGPAEGMLQGIETQRGEDNIL